MAKRKNKVKMYLIHILHENYWNWFITQRTVDLIKKHHGYMLSKPKNPMLFCGSVAFRKQEQARAFFDDCKDFLDVALDLSPSYMKRKYLREEDKND